MAHDRHADMVPDARFRLRGQLVPGRRLEELDRRRVLPRRGVRHVDDHRRAATASSSPSPVSVSTPGPGMPRRPHGRARSAAHDLRTDQATPADNYDLHQSRHAIRDSGHRIAPCLHLSLNLGSVAGNSARRRGLGSSDARRCMSADPSIAESTPRRHECRTSHHRKRTRRTSVPKPSAFGAVVGSLTAEGSGWSERTLASRPVKPANATFDPSWQAPRAARIRPELR